MMTAEELRWFCSMIRARMSAAGPPEDAPEVDENLVARIESEVREYRAKFLTRPAPQLPPEPLRDVLPAMGWLIYEASLDRLWPVPTGYGGLQGVAHAEAATAVSLVKRLANAARGLIWPEFAPRALGAIRAEALIASKLDTEEGFEAAWILHREADDRYRSYRDSLGDDPARERYIVTSDEVFLQLALAETGTACRTAERVLGRWDEEFKQGDPEQDRHDSEAWTQRMFLRLVEGVETGERALTIAQRIKARHGFVQHVTEDRMALPTALRNPAIMTCRAILLAYSLCPEMERLGRIPPTGATAWAGYQTSLRERFNKAFTPLLAPVTKDGKPQPLNAAHLRSLVQICLHLGLVTPNHPLPQDVSIDNGPTLRVLDDDAVEAMSAWLATVVEGKQRGDANIVGSSSKPDFNASVEACRKDTGTAADYRKWRIDWFELDRYATEPGRRARIAAMFDVPESSFPSPRGGTAS